MPSMAILRRFAKSLLSKPLLLISVALAVLVLPLIEHGAGVSRAATGDNCHGLHAGLTAQFNSYTEEPTIQLNFLLLNDSELPLDSAVGSWRIVIDGKDREDSGMIFGNGVGPSGGYNTLSSGDTYGFAKALSVVRYFPERRNYTVSWKGKAFSSPTLKIRGGLPQ